MDYVLQSGETAHVWEYIIITMLNAFQSTLPVKT